MFFEGFDFTGFWEKSSEENCGPLTPEMVAAAEKSLGLKLPASYVWLMERHNGGRLAKRHFLTSDPDWTKGYVNIESLYGISQGEKKGIRRHLTNFLVIGSIAAPFTEIGLNYQSCGPDGEPDVLFVNWDRYEFRHLADTFEDFIRGLVSDDDIPSENRANGECIDILPF